VTDTGEMSRFRGDIEGLRGVAVLLVVFGHLTGWPRGGFIGVDVFFVISGFLITGLLVSERERTGRISIRGFYARRARRLLPAGILVLALTDLAAAVLLLPSRAHETFVDSVWAFGFLANVHFAQLGTDYFSLTRAPSAVQHYWSLSVEEQFYLVWPCLILLTFGIAKRAGRRALVVVTAVVVAASLAWSVISTANSPASAYFSSPARAWELGAGALLVLV
jgi:peptidoglycan/LPS O-acetylase OafA/YrhL